MYNKGQTVYIIHKNHSIYNKIFLSRSSKGQPVWPIDHLGGICDPRNVRAHCKEAILQGFNTVIRVQGWSPGSLNSTRPSKQWTRPRHSGQEQNWWRQRQGWTQGYSMYPKSINESATETGDKLQLLFKRSTQEKFPTAQTLDPARDRAEKGLEISTPKI